MTEKRYLRVLTTGDIKDTVTGELIRGSKIGDLLNELYEDFNDALNTISKMQEENQDLATKKEDSEYELLHLKEKYEELLKENEQLKEENKELEKHIQELSDYIEELGGWEE